jgi:peptide/nickel transport system substrate-binding protein
MLLCLLAPLAWQGQAEARDELVIGIRQAPGSLHPLFGPSAARSFLIGPSLRVLSGTGRDGRPNCYVCETLPTIENGGARVVALPDGRQGMDITFTLKRGLSWADGEPVTSRDAEFSWQLASDPQVSAPNTEAIRHVTGITVLDSRRFTVHLDRIDYSYNKIALWILPEHIEGPIRARLANPADYFRHTAYVTNPTNPGLWFGPYRLVGYEPGRGVRYERNPYWPGPPAHIPRITVRIFENTPVLEAAFLVGGVDYIAGELGLTVDQGLDLKAHHAFSYTYAIQSGFSYEHIDLNHANPLLADRRVRQAMLLAIDRQTITRRLFDGLLPVADGFVPPIDAGYFPDVRKYAYDPAAAERLLSDAGFRPGPDGVRVDGQGRRLAFTFATTAGNRVRELVEQELQAKWQAVGIWVTLANDPAAVLFDRVRHGKFDMALYSRVTAPDAPPAYSLLSESIPTAENGFFGGNYTRYADPETDRLVAELVGELDPEKRLDPWARLQRRYAEELPALPLYFDATVFAIPTWLKGIDPAGRFGTTTQWIEEWRAD